jgi:glycosyltransferase involved in cell wall biosynthesis
MKVLHVIPAVAPRYGGPSRAVVGMCHALRGTGVECLVAATDADGPGRLAVELGVSQRWQGVPMLFFPRQWSEAFKYSRPLSRWVRTHVEEFDLVHVHAVYSHASIAASVACRCSRVPYVVRPLGSLAPWALARRRALKRALWHSCVGRMLRGAAAIHYTTDEERHLAERALGLGRGVVIPLGVEAATAAARDGGATPGPRPDTGGEPRALGSGPYVLALGRLHPVKGLETLIEAFLDVANDGPFRAWRLVLGGDGEAGYVGRLQRLVRERGGDDRVIFAGWLDGEDKSAALQGAAVLALPSHQESFGLAALEAMASGVPVVVSERVSLAQAIQATGAGWVAALERQALTSVLRAAMEDRLERVSRGAAGRALAQARFSWPVIAESLRDLYASLLEGRREAA